MKKVLLLMSFIISLHGMAQNDRMGITFGATNYIPNSNWLSSKSGTGFTIGAIGTKAFSERLELFLEINYNSHRVKFIGRETELSIPEDIKFKLDKFSIPAILNYKYLLLEDFKLGVNVGPSFDFIHDYDLLDDTKETYLLDPLLAQPKNLKFDTFSIKEDISFNMFLALGLNIEYQEILMASFRYYYGITDPYRRAPVVSIIDISGRDSYFTFTTTFFF